METIILTFRRSQGGPSWESRLSLDDSPGIELKKLDTKVLPGDIPFGGESPMDEYQILYEMFYKGEKIGNLNRNNRFWGGVNSGDYYSEDNFESDVMMLRKIDNIYDAYNRIVGVAEYWEKQE